MFRGIIERLSRGRVIRRRLPHVFGSRRIYLSPDSALQYWKPNWAKDSRALLSVASRFVRAGDCVWDIGANVGVFTYAAAHQAGGAGLVVAVEPDPFLANLLQRSALERDNQDVRVSVLCAAASDELGLARLLIAKRGRSLNALQKAQYRSQAQEARYEQFVPTITLDSFLACSMPPDFIKIDVEGAENLVLAGASRVLAEVRPTLYVEVGGESNEEVTRLLKSYRYRLFDGDSVDECERDNCAWNTLAVPEESSITNRG